MIRARPGLSRFPALFTLFRECQRLLVGAFADTETLYADRQAGVVHHGEHAGYPVVLCAHQVTVGAAVVTIAHDAGGAAVNAQFMFDGHRLDVVTVAGGTVRVHHILRHQEQADALDARRRVGQARQDQVQDIVRKVMVAPGDEDFPA